MSPKITAVRKLKKPDGTVAITFDGKLHSWDEPALVHPDGKKEYYINGVKYSFDDWKEARRNRSGLPWYKNPSMKSRNAG
jgi:hypothetical protein